MTTGGWGHDKKSFLTKNIVQTGQITLRQITYAISKNVKMNFVCLMSFFFFLIFADSLPESELLEMNDAEQKSKPKDDQRIRGGGGIYAQGKGPFKYYVSMFWGIF